MDTSGRPMDALCGSGGAESESGRSADGGGLSFKHTAAYGRGNEQKRSFFEIGKFTVV